MVAISLFLCTNKQNHKSLVNIAFFFGFSNVQAPSLFFNWSIKQAHGALRTRKRLFRALLPENVSCANSFVSALSTRWEEGRGLDHHLHAKKRKQCMTKGPSVKIPRLPKYGYARWGRGGGGGWSCPFLKNVEMKKKKKKQPKNANSIDTMFNRNFTLFHERRARFTHGSYSHVTVRRAGSRSLPRRERSGEERASKIKSCRQDTCLSCPMRSTLISPGHFHFLFQWFWRRKSLRDRYVQQMTSGRFQRRARNKFGKQSTKVLQSLPGVNLLLASSQIKKWKKNSRSSLRRGLSHNYYWCFARIARSVQIDCYP